MILLFLGAATEWRTLTLSGFTVTGDKILSTIISGGSLDLPDCILSEHLLILGIRQRGSVHDCRYSEIPAESRFRDRKERSKEGVKRIE